MEGGEVQMNLEYIEHDLKELKVHINNLESYIYANIGLVDNYTLTNDQLHEKSKYEFEMLNSRLTDLRLAVQKQRKQSTKLGDDVI